MIAKVIRNGSHSGAGKFVEVQETPSSPCYAVPVSEEIPVGSDVEIVVTLKALPKEPEPVVEDKVVSPASAEAFAVETSPIAPESAPSGQSSDEGVSQAAKEGENVGVLKQGKLPEDFPSHAALAAEGVNTFGQLRKRIDAGTLTDIPGIGEASAEKINAALEEE